MIENNTIENSGNNSGGGSIHLDGFMGDGTCNTTIPYFVDLSEIGQPPPGNNPTPVTVKGNSITNTPGWGITLNAAGACIDNNTINSAGSGMNIYGPGYSNSQSNNNKISNNVITSAGNNGIVLAGSGNTIDSNTVTNTGGQGFYFNSQSQNNIITNNEYFKIFMSSIFLPIQINKKLLDKVHKA